MSQNNDRYVSCDPSQLLMNETLPVNLYICLDFRFITYKNKGDVIPRETCEQLQIKNIRSLFIKFEDQETFRLWNKKQHEGKKANIPLALNNVLKKANRTIFDIFQSNHPDKIIQQTISASKQIVKEIQKTPIAIRSLSQLQTYATGLAEHSVNVSVLSTYLAMQLGYNHNIILSHIAAGGLLHDIGKSLVNISTEDSAQTIADKMLQYPLLGSKMIENQENVPTEVKMIVSQHHEYHDGSGLPNKLRANGIYDLAKIVSIANAYDEAVGDSVNGTLAERQKQAIFSLEKMSNKFDPIKLQKALKVLKLGV